jgi:hypothetical protein
MTSLGSYLQDGADYQAKAVLAYLQIEPELDASYNKERHVYESDIQVGRWENCREQGYVLSLRVEGSQLNIAFFEHRNSDSICAIRWEQCTINTPTIETIQHAEGVYESKRDISFEVSWEEFRKMADWIKKELNNYYKEKTKETEKV